MRENEHLVDRWTGRTLRSGVWLSAALLVFGLLLTMIAPPQGVQENPGLGDILRNILRGYWDPLTVICAGLVVLMLTPFFRVAAALAAFWAERDTKFVLAASIVLALLIGEFIYSFR